MGLWEQEWVTERFLAVHTSEMSPGVCLGAGWGKRWGQGFARHKNKEVERYSWETP